MDKIMCGELKYHNKKYYFNFRSNILVIQPEKMEDYTEWWSTNLSNKKNSLNERLNVEGETNEGRYICFVNIKFSQLGRGILQAFVPAYILGETNTVSPLPKCIDIEKISFEGKSLDKFCYPKHNIKHNDFRKKKSINIEIDYKQFQKKEFTIDKDVFSYGTNWSMPISSDSNNVLNVNTVLTITFNEPKNIKEIIDYYCSVENFFVLLIIEE